MKKVGSGLVNAFACGCVIFLMALLLVGCSDTITEVQPVVFTEQGPVRHIAVEVYINDEHRGTFTTCDGCTPDLRKRAEFYVPPVMQPNDIARAIGYQAGYDDGVSSVAIPDPVVLEVMVNNALEGTFRDLYDEICATNDATRMASLAHEWSEVTAVMVQRTGSGPLPLVCR